MRHQHGQPVVGDLPSEFFFPELQLDDAVSHRKGCYVGQEAVEMVRSRGKLPAKIMRAQIQGIIETGNHIIKTGSDETVGSVVSIALDHKHNTTWSFARIRKYADLPSALFLDTGAQVELTEIN
jgi:folate-binding protein YgfZ